MLKYHDKFPNYVAVPIERIPMDAAQRVAAGWDPARLNVCGMCPEEIECKEYNKTAKDIFCTAGAPNVWIPVDLAVKLRMDEGDRAVEPLTSAVVKKSFTLLPRHPSSMP